MASFRAGIFILAVFSGAPAMAASLTGSSPGYHYFYKQGATMEEHDAALVDCALRTRALSQGAGISDDLLMQSASTGGYGGGFVGGALAGLIGGIVDGNEERQGDAANTENCMAIKGWSVVGIDDVEGEAIRQLDAPAPIGDRLRPFVEAPSAAGPVLRGPFANELAVGTFAVGPATDLDKQSLSVRATRDRSKAAVEQAGELKPPKPNPPKGVKAPKALKMIKAVDFAAASPEKSYVILRVVGGGVRPDSVILALGRLAPDGTEVVYDGAAIAALIGATPTIGKGSLEGNKYRDFAVEAPPGRWKLAAISSGMAADLCFGAPAFDLGEGEVVSLGVLTLSKSGGYPLTQDLAVAREILAANPALAEKVKAAEWTNGYASDCFGSYAYAYEIPGAPFVDMDALARGAAAAPDDASPPPDTISSGEDAEQ